MMVKKTGIQLLRIIACFMILIHHLQWDVEKPLTLGRSAVAIFVVISGFLAGYYSSNVNYIISFKENCIFIVKKIKKFYGVYFCSYFGSIMLIVIQGIISNKQIPIFSLIIKSILFLTLTQVWIPNDEYIYSIVPACWYLSMIIFLYFMQNWLVYVAKKMSYGRRMLSLLLSICLLSIITVVVYHSKYCNYILYFFPFSRTIDFWIAIVAGMTFNEKEKSKISNLNNSIQTVIQIIALLIFIISLFVPVSLPWQYNLFYLIIALIVVVSFALPGGDLQQYQIIQ